MYDILDSDSLVQRDKTSDFYTEEEQRLLYRLENGLEETTPHHKVMEKLRATLGLKKDDEI